MSSGWGAGLGAIGTGVGFAFGGPAGAAIGGSLGAGIGGSIDAGQNTKDAKAAAKMQIQFQDEMSRTAHQREVNDLMAAGLNPNLSAGGNGAATPGGASYSPTMAPQISMPDMMAYGISMKQLEQTDKKLAIDQANSAAGIAKTLSDADLNKMKKIMMQKGMVRAELEGEGAGILRNIIKFIKKNAINPDPRKLRGRQQDPFTQIFEEPDQPSIPLEPR